MTHAIRFAEYGFTYAGAPGPSLSAISLDIPGGQVVAVLSPQGSGKTTFLRAAAGLLGDVYQGDVNGSVTRADPRRPGAFFDGYVQVTLAVETVREEIALPLYAAGVDAAGRAGRADQVARELRIEHLLDREVTALSGGEEKLVGIAASLVPDVSLHVLDEPFEQLDVPHFSAVIRAMKRRARAGRLVLVGTGSVDNALNISDSILVGDGRAWRLAGTPTYADVTSIPGLADSSMSRFLADRALPLSGVRRFRDGVVRAS